VADNCGSARDWASNRRTLLLVWGLPSFIMLAAALSDTVTRAVVWIAMLLWMGGACLLNARRCTRTHCRLTGPFCILMAGLVAGYAMDATALGTHGWLKLGGITFFGFAILWWGSERVWGKFAV